MTKDERLDLARDVATIIAEAMKQDHERSAQVYDRLIERNQAHQRSFDRLLAMQQDVVGLERQQLEILGRIAERQDHISELQTKTADALGLIIEKLRHS